MCYVCRITFDRRFVNSPFVIHTVILKQLNDVPLSMLKLVMSVEVSSSSDDKPSLCSALLPFCSLA